jgi:hypothetical protein
VESARESGISSLTSVTTNSLVARVVVVNSGWSVFCGRPKVTPIAMDEKDEAIRVPFGGCSGAFHREDPLGPESRSTIPVLGDSGIWIEYPRPPRGRLRCLDVARPKLRREPASAGYKGWPTGQGFVA